MSGVTGLRLEVTYNRDTGEFWFADGNFTKVPHAPEFLKLKKELAEARAEAERLRAERRWIPVEKRLPEAECPVLTLCDGKTRSIQYRFHGGGWTTSATVTHWMPLPEPPKKEVQP